MKVQRHRRAKHTRRCRSQTKRYEQHRRVVWKLNVHPASRWYPRQARTPITQCPAQLADPARLALLAIHVRDRDLSGLFVHESARQAKNYPPAISQPKVDEVWSASRLELEPQCLRALFAPRSRQSEEPRFPWTAEAMLLDDPSARSEHSLTSLPGTTSPDPPSPTRPAQLSIRLRPTFSIHRAAATPTAMLPSISRSRRAQSAVASKPVRV